MTALTDQVIAAAYLAAWATHTINRNRLRLQLWRPTWKTA